MKSLSKMEATGGKNAAPESHQQGCSTLPAAGGRNVRAQPQKCTPPPPPPPPHHQSCPLPQREMAAGHTRAGTTDLKLRASQEFQTQQSGIEHYIYRGGNAEEEEGGGGGGCRLQCYGRRLQLEQRLLQQIQLFTPHLLPKHRSIWEKEVCVSGQTKRNTCERPCRARRGSNL